MPRWIATLLFIATTQSPSFGANLALEWTYQYALANTERGLDVRYILANIEADATLREAPMLDLIAEVALFNASNLPFSQVDLRRITKVIVRSENPRYALAMNRLAAKTEGPGAYMEDSAKQREDLHELADLFAQRHAKAQAPQYQPGSIDIAAMRNRYFAASLTGKHSTEQARALLALPATATIDDVFTIAGPPEFVTIGRSSMNRRGYGYQLRNVDQMFFHYRGLGRVMLFYDHGVGWQVGEVIADPLRFEPLMPYRADPARYGQPDEVTLRIHEVLSGSHFDIRRALEAARVSTEMPPELYDTAAEVLLAGFEHDNSAEAMSTWVAICSALAREPERYADVLAAVAAKTSHPDLLSVSANVHAYEEPTVGSRYVPGSLSLEAQRHKYPPLYPSTLIGSSTRAQ